MVKVITFILKVLCGFFLLIGALIRLLGEALVRIHEALMDLIDKMEGYW